MGYDFAFARLASQPGTFPFKMPRDFGEKDLKPFEDLDGLRSAITSKGYSRIATRPTEFRLNFPDGGSFSLDLSSASTGWVSGDVHTHWRYVLDVFTHLHAVFDDIVIVDTQTAIIHDAATFGGLIESKYLEETERIRGLANCLSAKP